MKRLLPLALRLSCLSSCTLVYSSRRYSPQPTALPAGFQAESG